MSRSSAALLIAWRGQYLEWPHQLKSLRWQEDLPEEIVICIDDPLEQAPPLPSDLPLKVVRSSEALAGRYSRGAAINEGIKATKSDLILVTDGDCILSPRLISWYRRVMTGQIVNFKFTARAKSKGEILDERSLYKAEPVERAVYVGPRHFIPHAGALFDWMLWDDYLARWSGALFGCRGFTSGRAAIHGCNMGFPRQAITEAGLFPDLGRGQDARWFKKARAIGWKCAPMPDDAFVLHMGPDFRGRSF